MINNRIEEMIQKLESVKEDAVKFDEKGNNVAGTRVNKMFSEIREMCKEGRQQISEIRRKK